MIPLFRGFWGQGIRYQGYFGDPRYNSHKKSWRNVSAGITSHSKKSHSFVNFHWIWTNETPKWPECSLQTCPIIDFLLSQLGFSGTEP